MEEKNHLVSELILKNKAKDLKFASILPNGSALGLYSKPSLAILGPLKQKYNLSLVVTILGENQRPQAIQKQCKKHSISWFYINIQGGAPRYIRANWAEMAKGVISVVSLIQKKKHVTLVHCASGMHRTGVFAYSLLKTIGLDSKATMSKIKQIREITFKNVGKERIQIADVKILPQIEKMVEKVEEQIKKEQEKKAEAEVTAQKLKLLKEVSDEPTEEVKSIQYNEQ